MVPNVRAGVVIFTGDRERLARFYSAMTALPIRVSDGEVTVLGSDAFELVIHRLEGEPIPGSPPPARLDAYIKPFFLVSSLAAARTTAPGFGGELRPKDEEWKARGFIACEGVDPDGNPIQFRQLAIDE